MESFKISFNNTLKIGNEENFFKNANILLRCIARLRNRVHIRRAMATRVAIRRRRPSRVTPHHVILGELRQIRPPLLQHGHHTASLLRAVLAHHKLTQRANEQRARRGGRVRVPQPHVRELRLHGQAQPASELRHQVRDVHEHAGSCCRQFGLF